MLDVTVREKPRTGEKENDPRCDADATGVDERTITRIGPVCERIAAEYREMPGLSLTAAQAARLFGLDSDDCVTVLHVLIAEGRLRRTEKDRYCCGRRRRAGLALDPVMHETSGDVTADTPMRIAIRAAISLSPELADLT